MNVPAPSSPTMASSSTRNSATPPGPGPMSATRTEPSGLVTGTRPGGKGTLDACRAVGRPFLIAYQGAMGPSRVGERITEKEGREGAQRGGEPREPPPGERAETLRRRVFAACPQPE